MPKHDVPKQKARRMRFVLTRLIRVPFKVVSGRDSNRLWTGCWTLVHFQFPKFPRFDDIYLVTTVQSWGDAVPAEMLTTVREPPISLRYRVFGTITTFTQRWSPLITAVPVREVDGDAASSPVEALSSGKSCTRAR